MEDSLRALLIHIVLKLIIFLQVRAIRLRALLIHIVLKLHCEDLRRGHV